MNIKFTDFDGNTKTGKVLYEGFVSVAMPKVYEVEVDGIKHTTMFVNPISLTQIKYLSENPWA